MKNMKRITAVFMALFAGFVLVVVIGGYMIKAKTTKASGSGTMPANAPTTVSLSSGTTTFKDGVFLGSVAINMYGPVQVKVTVAAGKITRVAFVQMPTNSPVSVKIAASVEPALQQETLTAQSANIAIVSRATYDSNSYIQSLQVALTQAKAS